MKVAIDSAGRVLIPKALRQQFGFEPGSSVDVTPFGPGVAITPAAPTAKLRREGRFLVADTADELTDEAMFGLIDAARR